MKKLKGTWEDTPCREVKLTDEERMRLISGTKYTVYDPDRSRFYVALAVFIVFTVALIVILLYATKPEAAVTESAREIYPNYEEPYEKPIRQHLVEKVRRGMDLPEVSGAKKTYMDFRKITRSGSDQLLLQAHAYTDNQGFRKVGDYYLVALGTFYVKEIGDTFEVSFSDGHSIKVMAGDVKADCHTDKTNRYHLSDGSVIEFIIDKKAMDEKVIRTGDCSWLIGHGAVTEIRRIG